MALPVALQLYSVRDELEADFEGTIAKVKEFGYDGVEFAGLYGRSAEQVRKILADAGLTPVSAPCSARRSARRHAGGSCNL